jgi:uncharacterized protein YbjT (DUF2867 family)
MGSDPRPILVTGATGNVGGALLRALAANGLPARAAVARPGDAKAPAGVETVRFDFRDRSGFAAAVRGCRGLFLLRPPAISDVGATLNALVDVARREGAGQVVFLSVTGADRNRLVPHHGVERHLESSPGAWTILRPGFFAQNLGDAYRRDIAEEDRIVVPAGAGRVAWIDVRDVAEVAALVFADPDAHHGKGYTLVGPEAVSFTEVARVLSEALARPIRYEAAGAIRYAIHLRRRGLPLTQVVVQTVLHLGLRSAGPERLDPTLGLLLGRPGRTISDYVRDHAALWRR